MTLANGFLSVVVEGSGPPPEAVVEKEKEKGGKMGKRWVGCVCGGRGGSREKSVVEVVGGAVGVR